MKNTAVHAWQYCADGIGKVAMQNGIGKVAVNGTRSVGAFIKIK